jgi:hypothetical protein
MAVQNEYKFPLGSRLLPRSCLVTSRFAVFVSAC